MITDGATIQAADHAARHWTSTESGRLMPGSPAYRRATCRLFHVTFNPYKPAVIDRPALDLPARGRLIALPIWDIAVQIEGKARLRMAAFAGTLNDAEMAEAIALNAWEEGRHKEVLSRVIEAYDVPLAPEPEYRTPRDTEWAYLVTGFGECVDSFFAFGCSIWRSGRVSFHPHWSIPSSR